MAPRLRELHLRRKDRQNLAPDFCCDVVSNLIFLNVAVYTPVFHPLCGGGKKFEWSLVDSPPAGASYLFEASCGLPIYRPLESISVVVPYHVDFNKDPLFVGLGV